MSIAINLEPLEGTKADTKTLHKAVQRHFVLQIHVDCQIVLEGWIINSIKTIH